MNNFTGVGRVVSMNYIEGSNVLKFRVAIKNSMKDKPDNFVPCVCFGKTAEMVNKWFKVGSPIGVMGQFTSNNYEKDGSKFVSYEIVVNNVSFLPQESKKSVEGETQEMKQQIQEKKAGNPQGKLAQAKQEVKEEFGDVNDDDFDEDIPF